MRDPNNVSTTSNEATTANKEPKSQKENKLFQLLQFTLHNELQGPSQYLLEFSMSLAFTCFFFPFLSFFFLIYSTQSLELQPLLSLNGWLTVKTVGAWFQQCIQVGLGPHCTIWSALVKLELLSAITSSYSSAFLVLFKDNVHPKLYTCT